MHDRYTVPSGIHWPPRRSTTRLASTISDETRKFCVHVQPKAGDVTRTWHVIDATDVVLGRLAVQAATLLRGKHKPTYSPNLDGGDFVIVINAEKVAISGNKRTDKFHYHHSGFPGGSPCAQHR